MEDAGIAAAIGLGLGVLATAHYENGNRAPTTLMFTLGSAAAGALIGAGSEPKETYRDRVIYMRP